MDVWSEESLRERLSAKVLDQPNRYLWRGQSKKYASVTPTIARVEGLALGQAYTILRRFVGQYRGQVYPLPLRGLIKVEPEEAIALLQHYGWPTPYLDLTGDLDVAFFFAHSGYRPEDGEAIMYVLDTASLGKSHVIVSHDQVVDPALNIRWSRQNGYAIRPTSWIDMDEVRKLDLCKQPYVEEYAFQPCETRRALSAKKLLQYSTVDSAVTAQLEFLIDGIAEMCDFHPLAPELEKFPH